MDEAFDAVERALAMKALQDEPMMLSRTLQGEARLLARTLTDRRALDFAAERRPGRNLAVPLATHPKIGTPGDTDMAWRIVIQGRNVVVDEMAARQQTVIAEAQNAAVRDSGPRSIAPVRGSPTS